MCKYKPSRTKIETFYMVVLLNIVLTTDLKTTNNKNADIILSFLSGNRQFFVSDSRFSI